MKRLDLLLRSFLRILVNMGPGDLGRSYVSKRYDTLITDADHYIFQNRM
jgi:hypothetical protein